MKKLVLVVLALVGVGFAAFYWWATGAGSADLDASRNVITALEKGRVLTQHSCGPNTATIDGSAWEQLTETRQRNVMLALARVCIEEGGGSNMEMHEARTLRVLATFDGRNMGR